MYAVSKRLLRKLALVVLMIFVLLPTLPATTSASSFIFAPDENSLKEKVNLNFSLDPLDVKQGSFYVKNPSEEKSAIEMKLVDSVAEDRVLSFKLPHQKNIEIGKWMTLDENQFELGPGEGKTVNYVLELPEDAAVGDYVGGLIIIASPVADDSDTEAGQQNVGSGAKVVARNAKVVRLVIKGDPIWGLELLENPKLLLNHEEEDYGFEYRLQNTGNKHLDFRINQTVTSLFGRTTELMSRREITIYANRRAEYKMPWENFKHGIYKSNVFIEYAPGLTLEREFWFVTFPIIYLVLAVLGALLLLYIIVHFIRGYLRLSKQVRELGKNPVTNKQIDELHKQIAPKGKHEPNLPIHQKVAAVHEKMTPTKTIQTKNLNPRVVSNQIHELHKENVPAEKHMPNMQLHEKIEQVHEHIVNNPTTNPPSA